MIQSDSSTAQGARTFGVRRILEARRRIRDENSSLRESTEEREQTLRDWEAKLNGKQARGRRWRSMLSECRSTIGPVCELYMRILHGEQEALRHFGAAVGDLRKMPEGSEFHATSDVLKSLEECARLQGLEIQWIEEAVKISRKIERVPVDVRPDQVIHLLELRRRYLDQIDSLKTEATEVETRVWKLSAPEDAPPSEEVSDSEEVYEINGDEWEVVESDGSATEARPNGLESELERTRQSLMAAIGERDEALATSGELTRELDDARVEIDKLRDSEAEDAEPPAEPSADPDRIRELEEELVSIRSELAAAKEIQAVVEGDSSDHLKELETRIAQLASEKEQAVGRLAETEERLKENTVRLLAEKHKAENTAEARHSAREADLDTQVSTLTKERDEALATSERADRELTRLKTEVKARATEVDAAQKALAMERAEWIASRESMERELTELRENVGARGKEVSDLRKTLAGERAEVEANSASRERELTSLREDLGAREAELAELRGSFSEERTKLEERARLSERERDQAAAERNAGLARARDLLVNFGQELTRQVEDSARLLSAEAEKLTRDK